MSAYEGNETLRILGNGMKKFFGAFKTFTGTHLRYWKSETRGAGGDPSVLSPPHGRVFFFRGLNFGMVLLPRLRDKKRGKTRTVLTVSTQLPTKGVKRILKAQQRVGPDRVDALRLLGGPLSRKDTRQGRGDVLTGKEKSSQTRGFLKGHRSLSRRRD